MDRRNVIIGVSGVVALAPLSACQQQVPPSKQETNMYGLIGKMTAVDGKRDELSAILLEGLKDMPGNISYVVANDPANPNNLWITEVWTDKAAHENSLTLPSVQSAIGAGRPLLAGMERIAETQPIGGHDL